ncbi:hypothetical protein BE221DRAFT_55909, partial [Ostreococcus tauri]
MGLRLSNTASTVSPRVSSRVEIQFHQSSASPLPRLAHVSPPRRRVFPATNTTSRVDTDAFARAARPRARGTRGIPHAPHS